MMNISTLSTANSNLSYLIMKKTLLTVCATALASIGVLHSQTISDTLPFTGAMQTFTVPCGVTSVTIECLGAQGASGANGGNNSTGGAGGNGGSATGTLMVTPTQVLNVFVGGQGSQSAGGFNGGGAPGIQTAGGGGGASDVRVGGTAAADRVIVAGGGGGGGRGGCEPNSVAGGAGGQGGGTNGSNGVTSPNGGGGFGGTSAGGGGAAGIGCSGFLGLAGSNAAGEVGGQGGAGQACCCFSATSIPGGGGGGGGFNGGGGGGGGSAGTTGCSGNDKGGGGGGAGGTNYTGGVANGVATNGVRTGDGIVVITYTLPTPGALTISGSSAICHMMSTNLSCTTDTNATDYNWTVPAGLTLNSGQNTSTINITGATAGTYTVSVAGVNTPCTLTGPTATFVITVNANPTIGASATPGTVCSGDADTLTVAGAMTYMWSSGGTSSMEIVTPTSSTTYTVVGMDANGCMDTATVSVNVNPLPTVTATGGTICNGDSIALTATGASTYMWSSGGTGSTEVVMPNATMDYTVTGVDSNGCWAMDTVTVIVNPLPVLTTSNDTTVCAGSNVTMMVSGASTYSWSSGGTAASETVAPTSTTTYTVTGTDGNNCSSDAMITVNVDALPTVTYSIPAGTHCVNDGNFALTGGSPAGGNYFGTAVTGGMFSPATAGVGAFQISYMFTDSNGCAATAVDTMAVSACVGIAEINSAFGMTLMPNPVSDNLILTWDANKASVTTLEVFDNAGRLVMTSRVNGGNTATLDVTSLPAGNYSLSVTTTDSKENHQFIKH